MKKVFLGLLLAVISVSAKAQTTEKTDDMALRWLMLRGIVAIPKSTHKERMMQNFDILDFSLTDEEMAQIATLNQYDEGTVNFNDPEFIKYLIGDIRVEIYGDFG